MALDWTPHPLLKIPSTDEQINMGASRLLEYWERREGAIDREREDPFRYGTELPHWKKVDDILEEKAELLLLGGNRSGKTEIIAKRVVQSLVANPGSVIWCFTATSQNSIAHQQAVIHKYLPAEFKNLGRSRVHYISYSVKNGYTSSSFVLPNRSMCVFRNWSQNIETIEGGEVGCKEQAKPGTHNIGIWFDEEVPQNWLTTARFRCLTRSDPKTGIPARMISTFTTISGWTNCVASFLSGAVTLEDKEAELLPGERVPIIQQPIRQGSRVLYFHTADNPYGGWPAMKMQLDGARRDEILTRAYGVPTKPSNTTFVNLDDRVVMKHEDIPVIKDKKHNPCNYILSIDPAGSKSWFMLLVAVDVFGVHYVLKEWPGVDVGEWADLDRGEKGVPGDASKPNGNGIGDYAKIIRGMLKGISDEDYLGVTDNVEIIIDPRMGSATYAVSEGTSNIIADLQDHKINVYPAEGLPIEDGLQAINSLLSYDKAKPIDLNNRSHLIFSDQVGNTLFCCMNYKVDDGLKGVCKDPTDCLRYIAIGNYSYLEDSELEATEPRGY